jgi:membrane protease YdiL (CAAX protease family)
MLIGTLVLTKVKDWKEVWGEESSKANVLLMGGAVAFGLRFALGLFVSLFPDFFAEASTGMLERIGALANITKEILAINAEYGVFWSFLFVVILVPMYEEIIFRGIMLGSMEKYLTFGGANVVQALLFAMIHDDLSLLPFYFAFGLLAGHLRKRSKGLAASMAMHGVNNLLAFIVIVQ